jgi:hypothetical protein
MPLIQNIKTPPTCHTTDRKVCYLSYPLINTLIPEYQLNLTLFVLIMLILTRAGCHRSPRALGGLRVCVWLIRVDDLLMIFDHWWWSIMISHQKTFSDYFPFWLGWYSKARYYLSWHLLHWLLSSWYPRLKYPWGLQGEIQNDTIHVICTYMCSFQRLIREWEQGEHCWCEGILITINHSTEVCGVTSHLIQSHGPWYRKVLYACQTNCLHSKTVKVHLTIFSGFRGYRL